MRINHLTRRELYEAVWKTPKSKLAVEYGISDVALAKICKKMKIPIPGRGYWQKLKAGKGVQSEPLTDFSGNSHISIRDLRSEMLKKDAKSIASLNDDRYA
ncbi:MAG: hypothetical protein ACP59X_00770 [Solidesulfovibrio sp. DCME]|uniref:hypothetical protein n=1 Tax=Solidesulfovibrio sp. DCME TaxID=3447380 RepID=UPI003D0C0442